MSSKGALLGFGVGSFPWVDTQNSKMVETTSGIRALAGDIRAFRSSMRPFVSCISSSDSKRPVTVSERCAKSDQNAIHLTEIFRICGDQRANLARLCSGGDGVGTQKF